MAGRRRWRRRPEEPVKLEQAQAALERARAQRREQASKREQEKDRVIDRMERLARDNHLGALVWDVVAGNGERK